MSADLGLVRPAVATPGGRRALHALLVVLVVAGLVALRPVGDEYDFCTYYTAGLLLREGHPEEAFDRDGLNRRHDALHDDGGKRYGPFLYSPFMLAPAAAFTLLPYDTAERLNHAMILGVLAGLLFAALERARSWWLRALLCLAVLVAHPVQVLFIQQNWSYLLVAAVAVAWVATRLDPAAKGPARRRREVLAALSWALALHVKPFAILFVAALAVAGRRQLAAASVLVAVLLAALALPWVGMASYLAYGEELRSIGAGVEPFYSIVSLQAVVARAVTGPPDWVRPAGGVDHPLVRSLGLLSLIPFALLLAAARREQERALALAIPWALLFVPQVWEHTEVLLFLLFLTPAFPAWAAAALAVALIASFPYRAIVGELFAAVLFRGAPAGILESVLLFYPALNTVVLAVLARGRRAACRRRAA